MTAPEIEARFPLHARAPTCATTGSIWEPLGPVGSLKHPLLHIQVKFWN